MNSELILTNAQLVLRDAVLSGTLVIRDGFIAAIDTAYSGLPQAVDCQGDYILPGLVELHTDNLERQLKPRPGVVWPALSAVVSHDAQLIAAGITTVLDAIALGEVKENTHRVELLDTMMNAVQQARQAGLLRADHWLHLRCEVVYPQLLNLWERYRFDPALKLVSLMDHSPGQRQFVQIDKYYEYYQGKYGLSDVEMAQFIAQQTMHAALYGANHRQVVVNDCQQQGIALASHDDATAAHAIESDELGAVIAEFPTTVEAARVSREQGMQVMMGAPNVVRGYSHSGNVSARELAALGLVDILSSDYVPSSLLLAAFQLEQVFESVNLAQAVALVSAEPAQALGLTDRGELAIGRLGDVVRVQTVAELPWVKAVWKRGQAVF